MLFDRLGTIWRDYKDRLATQLRVLVVDDEAAIRYVLAKLLSEEGFDVTVAGDVETGWLRLTSQPHVLMVVDKNLEAGQSGIELIARAHREMPDVASVLITAYPNIESVSEALAQGASDYITKPFPSLDQVVRRLKSVIDRRVGDGFYSRLVHDLTSVVDSEDRVAVQQIARELAGFKKSLAGRPSVLFLENDPLVLEVIGDTLGAVGLTVASAEDAGTALAVMRRLAPPVAALIDLAVPGAVDLVAQVRAAAPLAEVLTFATAARLDQALDAVHAGASDHVTLANEGMEILQARVARLVDRSRRQQLYVKLIAVLLRRASAEGSNLVGTLVDMLPSSQRALLDQMAAEDAAPLPGNASLAEVLEPVERRAHPRFAADLLAELRSVEGGADFELCKVSNVSVGGLFVTSGPLPHQTKLLVRVRKLGGQPVSAVGEVVRFVNVQPDTKRQNGWGIRILNPDESGWRALIEGWYGKPQ